MQISTLTAIWSKPLSGERESASLSAMIDLGAEPPEVLSARRYIMPLCQLSLSTKIALSPTFTPLSRKMEPHSLNLFQFLDLVLSRSDGSTSPLSSAVTQYDGPSFRNTQCYNQILCPATIPGEGMGDYARSARYSRLGYPRGRRRPASCRRGEQ